jgi:hypothetical protein
MSIGSIVATGNSTMRKGKLIIERNYQSGKLASETI